MNKLFAVATILTLITPIATARIINIPDDYSTIQAGINASANGDTILVQPGTYHELINFDGHCVSLGSLYMIDGDTAHISNTIIDGDSAGTVISVRGCRNNLSGIIGLTVRHGAGFNGGAIYLIGSNTLIMKNKILQSRTDTYGGGIFCQGSNPVIIHNYVAECYAYY